MRDILIMAIIFGSVPVILARPHFGIIMWFWVSYMNPHRLTWSFAYDMPVAMIVGVTTIAAWLISREPKKLPLDALSVIMLIYVLWTGVTTLIAIEPDLAIVKWEKFNKIMLMTFLAMILMQSRWRLQALVWITAVSIGFFSVKGGAFTIMTGGQYKIWGPPSSEIADNNALALATLVVVPLMRYLAITTTSKLIRYAMFGALGLSIVSVLGSYSRGAFLALAAMIVFLWWRSRKRWLLFALLGLAITFALPMMPQKWFDRMDTIQNYEEDSSAMARLEMWSFGLEVAAANPVFGGGFNVFQGGKAYDRLAWGGSRRNVHSIYFEVLGEHGIVGLILFLGMGIVAMRKNRWIRKQTAGRPEFAAAHQLANMTQVSLIAFAVGGTFQNLAHFDLFYGILAITLLNTVLLRRELAQQDEAAPQAATAGAGMAALPQGAAGFAARPSFLRPGAGS